jgi:bifunctional DNase/RNase
LSGSRPQRDAMRPHDLTRARRSSPWSASPWLCAALAFAAACAPPAPTPSPRSAAAEPVPAGFVLATAERVANTPAGPALLLRDTTGERFLTIFVSDPDAATLDQRLSRRRAERPQTIDLLEDVVSRLDAEVFKVHIDSLERGTFTSALFLLSEDRLLEVDARPSDAIALALTRRVPIYVRGDLFAAGGFSREALDEHRRGLRPSPFSPPQGAREQAPPPGPGPL